jgi:hypothetical protein
LTHFRKIAHVTSSVLAYQESLLSTLHVSLPLAQILTKDLANSHSKARQDHSAQIDSRMNVSQREKLLGVSFSPGTLCAVTAQAADQATRPVVGYAYPGMELQWKCDCIVVMGCLLR